MKLENKLYLIGISIVGVSILLFAPIISTSDIDDKKPESIGITDEIKLSNSIDKTESIGMSDSVKVTIEKAVNNEN